MFFKGLHFITFEVCNKILQCRLTGVVGRGTKGTGFESRVRHGCQTVRSRPHQWLRSITGRREVPDSVLGRTCRPSRSEFSVVFSETRVNTG